MLTRISALIAVNPQNVAAVLECGDMIITLRMANGRSHNIECSHKGECPAKFREIVKQLRLYDDFYIVDGGRAVNVNHIHSLAPTKPGIVINMSGDFSIYIPTKLKAETVERLCQALEAYR